MPLEGKHMEAYGSIWKEAYGRKHRKQAERPTKCCQLPNLGHPASSTLAAHQAGDGGVEVAAGCHKGLEIGVLVGKTHLRHQLQLRRVELGGRDRRGDRRC